MDHRRVDNYELLDELGYGGMATVWRANDTRLDREVAVKILHDHIASRPENRDRFEREAKAMARLRHPNIPAVYGFSSPSAPVQYIAVELIDGPTLRELVESDVEQHAGRIGAPEIGATLGLVVARALAHAHDSGVIHRDIKPENVMITSEGHPRLMDFGLARVMDATKLTQTGAILGSPAHMSPEVIEGGAVDHRADIFAFGTLLYYIATGVLPFDGRNPAVILNAILGGDYTPADRIDARVPPALSDLIDDCLRTDPDDRPTSMASVVERLEAIVGDAGLDEADAVLERWFVDPTAWVDGFRERRLGELEREAAEALRKGRVATSMRLADRILAWSPGHEGALVLLERARVRHRMRGLAWGGVAVVVLVSLAALVAIRFGGGDPVEPVPDPPDTAIAEADTGAAVNEPDVDEPEVDDGDAATDADPGDSPLRAAQTAAAALGAAVADHAVEVCTTIDDDEPDADVGFTTNTVTGLDAGQTTVRIDPGNLPRPDAGTEGSGDAGPEVAVDAVADVVAAATPIPFRLRVTPPTAFVLIDGSVPRGPDGQYLEQADAVNDHPIPLVPGTYTITAWLPDQEAFGVEQVVVVSADNVAEEINVAYAPARLTVSSPVDGDVQLARDGGPFRNEGRTGQPIDLPMRPGQYEAVVRVSVVPDGGGALLRSDEVVIGSGQNLTLQVDR